VTCIVDFPISVGGESLSKDRGSVYIPAKYLSGGGRLGCRIPGYRERGERKALARSVDISRNCGDPTPRRITHLRIMLTLVLTVNV
jgi:hypothetical protein